MLRDREITVNLTLDEWIDHLKKVSTDKMTLESNARKLSTVLAHIFIALFLSQHLTYVLKSD